MDKACGGLTIVGAPTKVAPGDTVTVTVKATVARSPATAVKGSLVAYADTGAVATVAMVVGTRRTGAPTPLVTSVSATKYRHRAGAVIWIPVDLGAATAVPFTSGEVLGAVTSDAGHGAITFAGRKQAHGATFLGLAVGRLPAGSYTGRVALTPGDDAGNVDVTLTVKDGWVLFLVALLAGLALAVVVQRITGVVVPRFTLRRKADRIRNTYENAVQRLTAAQGAGAWKTSTLTDLDDRIVEIKADISEKTAGAYVSIDSAVVTALQAEIDALDAAVTKLGDLAEVAPALTAALASYDHDAASVPVPPGVSLTEPALIGDARAKLVAYAVQVDDLPDLLSGLTAATEQVTKVKRLRTYVAALVNDIATLRQGGHVTPEELDRPETDLTAAWREIFTADNVDRLPALEQKLDGVDDALSHLFASVGRSHAPRRARMPVGRDDVEALTFDVEGSPPRVVDAASTARREAAMARWLEGFALLVGVVVAVATAYAALYVGKPFGSPLDYLAVLTWGLATPSALTAIGAALDNLGALQALGRRFRA